VLYLYIFFHLRAEFRFSVQGTSIFLIGMMGSGKTTTGKMLSNVLKRCFFDSDVVIEQVVGGATIPEIFEQNGEEGFRDIEQAVLSELAAYRSVVVATGGGVVARCVPTYVMLRYWRQRASDRAVVFALVGPMQHVLVACHNSLCKGSIEQKSGVHVMTNF
jgi:predicted kinase